MPRPTISFGDQPPRNLRRLFWLVPAFLLLIGTHSAGAAEPIKIGSFLTVTGPASFLGDPELKTLQMYVEDINAKVNTLNEASQKMGAAMYAAQADSAAGAGDAGAESGEAGAGTDSDDDIVAAFCNLPSL